MKTSPEKRGSRPFMQTTLDALNGIALGLESERSLRLHALAVALVVFMGVLVGLTLTEWALLFLTFGLLMALELVNTAIETVADFIHPDHHPAIKRIKDLAAGAVLIAAVFSVAIGIVLFAPKLILYF